MAKPCTEEEKQIMIEAYKNGCSGKEAADKVGRCADSCYNALDSVGITDREDLVTEKEKEVMVNAYKDGMSAEEASNLVGRSRWSCRKALEEQGVKIRYNVSEEDKNKAVELYIQEGKSLERVSKIVNISATHCSTVLRNRGYDIREQDEYRKYDLDTDFFKDISTEEQSYWLGFISADGYIKDRGVKVSLSQVDSEHLYKMKRSLNTNSPLRFLNDVEMVYLDICSKQIYRDLKSLVVSSKKGEAKIQPWCGPENLMKHYWRGFVDGDGGIYFQPNETTDWLVQLTGTKRVCESFRSFIYNNTDIEHIPIYKDERSDNVYTVKTGGTHKPQKVVKELYQNSNIYLDRKKEIADKLIAYNPKQSEQTYLKDYTKEDLESLYKNLGTWCKVAEYIGCSDTTLWRKKKKLKMLEKTEDDFFDFSTLDEEKIFRLKESFGTWRKVANFLDCSVSGLQKHRKRLGLL